jgi:uncharacterized protein YbbC (DUF1343 family)
MDRRLFLATAGAAAGLVACAPRSATTPSPVATPARANGPEAVDAGKVALGIDVLAAGGFAALQGQRVGLITNQTGVDGAGTFTRTILKAGLGDGLKRLFGPEHGLDTRVRAGVHVDNSLDAVTGLPVKSLYGAHRKPTREMIEDLDVLVFDIQDIGIRSYTYISTMILAMEAAGEAGKRFMVLDRPNPMGGVRVQGPDLLTGYDSFVSQVPVPYVHGLTVGELARMALARGWVKTPPQLDVIAMQGWSRAMNWADTGLAWVATSPNIPRWTSPYHCVATGILGELAEVDIGIATPDAFEVAAAAGVDADRLAADFTALAAREPLLRDVAVSPYRSASRPGFGGVRLAIDPKGTTDLCALSMWVCCEINARANGRPYAATSAASRSLFDKVYGGPALAQALREGGSWRALVDQWGPSLAAFGRDRAPHLLYS